MNRWQFSKAIAAIAISFAMADSSIVLASGVTVTLGFSVEDAVSYEWFVDIRRGIPARGTSCEQYAASKSPVCVYSSDGDKAAFVTRHGDLSSDCVEATIHLVERVTDEGQPSLRHRRLVTVRSCDNDPPIRDMRWVSPEKLAFVGKTHDSSSQIFALDLDGRLSQLTSDPGDKDGFDIGSHGEVVYGIRHQPNVLEDGNDVPGFFVKNQLLFDLLGFKRYGVGASIRYRAATGGSSIDLDVPVLSTSAFSPFISISPSGNYAVVASSPRLTPDAWTLLKLRVPAVPGSLTHWANMELYIIDLKSGTSRSLTNAPMGSADNKNQVVWDEERGRLFALDQYALTTDGDLYLDWNKPLIIEYSLTDGRMSAVDRTELLTPDDANGTIRKAWYSANDRSLYVVRGGERTRYSFGAGLWVKAVLGSNLDDRAPELSLMLRQSVDKPAQMLASVDNGRTYVRVIDTNKNLAKRYNPSREYAWRDKFGHKWLAGLTLPKDRKGQFPLIIQTHGFSPSEFVVTGDYGSSAGFSAQALASAGFAVLMMGAPEVLTEEARADLQRNEFEIHTEGFRSAIEALGEDGIIDKNRIGVIAWSRSGMWLQHALAFGDDLFDVAIAADASSFGTLSFMYYHNFYSIAQEIYLKLNKVRPYGDGLDVWRKTDPLTHVGSFDIPILIEDYENSFPSWWQAYVAMAESGKAVEYYSLREASHAPQRPSHQFAVQSLTLDWFRFWLQDYEGPDPEKAEQYIRWRKMRDGQCARLTDSDAPWYCKPGVPGEAAKKH